MSSIDAKLLEEYEVRTDYFASGCFWFCGKEGREKEREKERETERETENKNVMCE